MEKTLYKTKSGKFRILFSSCFILGIVWDKNDIYIPVGPFIFNIERKRTRYVKAIMIVLLTSFLISSCSGGKYGCGHGHPKQTWNKMVRRINSPY